MKTLKHFLILFSCAGIMFLSSCTDEDPVPPTVTFKGGAGYVDDNTTLEPSETFKSGITATAGDKKLATFTVKRSGIISATEVDSSISGDNFSFERNFTAAATEGVETWTFTVTDKDGESASVEFAITTVEPDTTTPLGSAQNFSWVRCGSSNNPDLSQFGLAWTGNTGSVAIIKKDADKLVILSSGEWSSITTVEGLMSAVDNGTDVVDYRGVDVVQASSTYDDVIATKKGSDYYILHITSSTVVDKTSTCGYEVTINGEYKN